MIPLNKFVLIRSDEGEEVKGFSVSSLYDDCHRATYTGTSIALFSKGFPFERDIYDFDVRERKDGLHVSNKSQISVQGLDSGLVQVRLAKTTIEGRLKESGDSLAPFLLDEYLDTICHLERALLDENIEEFSETLSSIGKRNSRKFIGYQPDGNSSPELGMNGALLFPEAKPLVGAIIRSAVSRYQCGTVYNTLNSTQFEFWPVASLPSGTRSFG